MPSLYKLYIYLSYAIHLIAIFDLEVEGWFTEHLMCVWLHIDTKLVLEFILFQDIASGEGSCRRHMSLHARIISYTHPLYGKRYSPVERVFDVYTGVLVGLYVLTSDVSPVNIYDNFPVSVQSVDCGLQGSFVVGYHVRNVR